MKPGVRVAVAAVLGGVVGGVVTLALPLPGRRTEPASAPEGHPRASTAVLGEAPVPTLLAWTPGGLPEGYPRAVARLDRVAGVAVVRSGTAWLGAWGDGEGPPRRPPDGFRIPVEVAAIRPSAYARFVPQADRVSFRELARGGALLGRSGASLREIGAGGRLELGGVGLPVLGVVDDGLVGAHEVVVSERTGRALGITRPRYLLVAPRGGATGAAVRRGLRRVLPEGVRVRVRGPGETPVFRHGDAVLPPVRLKELFGEFAAAPQPDGTLLPDPAWVERHIRSETLPILGVVRCHRAVLPQVRAALEELERRGLGERLNPGDFGGCYSSRFINRSPAAGISHHAWGIAIDVNVSQNPLGREPRIDPRVVEVFERLGFTWGGRWLVPDGMHFEFLRFPSGD